VFKKVKTEVKHAMQGFDAGMLTNKPTKRLLSKVKPTTIPSLTSLLRHQRRTNKRGQGWTNGHSNCH